MPFSTKEDSEIRCRSCTFKSIISRSAVAAFLRVLWSSIRANKRTKIFHRVPSVHFAAMVSFYAWCYARNMVGKTDLLAQFSRIFLFHLFDIPVSKEEADSNMQRCHQTQLENQLNPNPEKGAPDEEKRKPQIPDTSNDMKSNVCQQIFKLMPANQCINTNHIANQKHMAAILVRVPLSLFQRQLPTTVLQNAIVANVQILHVSKAC